PGGNPPLSIPSAISRLSAGRQEGSMMLRRKGIWLTTVVAAALLVPGAVALAQARPTGTPHPTASDGAFVHPGVLVDPAELDLVRGKVTAGTQPWSSAFGRLRATASLSHV